MFAAKQVRVDSASARPAVTSAGRPRVQTKLSVGPAGDSLEQEADRVADAVMAMRGPGRVAGGPPAAVQRKCDACEEEDTVQRKASGPGGAGEVDVGGLGGGRPLSGAERAFFEPRFGWDFRAVRVHDDSRADHLARSISAEAFTFGGDIAFRSGAYSPGGESSRRLMAHELTHVMQQRGGTAGAAAAAAQ